MCGTQSTGYTVLSPRYTFHGPIISACVNVRTQFLSCGFFAFKLLRVFFVAVAAVDLPVCSSHLAERISQSPN